MELTIEMPELTGTEKQIQWATDIRSDFFERCQKSLNRTDEWCRASQEWVVDNSQMLLDYVAKIFNHVDAAWWIDNRNNPFVISKEEKGRKFERPRTGVWAIQPLALNDFKDFCYQQ